MKSDLYNEVFGTIRGAWTARILMVANNIGLFDFLGSDEPVESDHVADELSLDKRAMESMLDDLCEMGFVHREGHGFMGTEISRLLSDPASSLHGYIEFHMGLWDAWGNLAETLKCGCPATTQYHRSESADEVRNYIKSMDALGLAPAKELAKMLPVKEEDSVLDLGGGSGIFILELLKKYPSMKSAVLERKVVCELLEREILETWTVSQLPDIIDGDYLNFHSEELYDWILLANVVHNESPEDNLKVIGTAASSLRPGGRIVILDYFESTESSKTEGPAGFSSLLLLFTDKGRIYRQDEVMEWIQESGLKITDSMEMKSGYKVLLCKGGVE